MRYIDADEAIRMIENDAPLQVYYRKSDAIDCINVTPTADVQEVRHGHWITKGLDNFRKIECKCSECGYIGISNYDSYDDPYDFNYCPSCGTKMDGEEAEAKIKELEEEKI